MTDDEHILVLLLDGPSSSMLLAEALAWNDRSVRRRLRRLIRDGYVFSPTRGLYRITTSGRAVIPDDIPQPDRPGLFHATARDVIERWTGRRR